MAPRTGHSRDGNPTTDELHPFVYRSIVALAAWFVLSVWILFNRGGYTELDIAVVTLFFVVVVTIPILIWLTWRRNAASDKQNRLVEPFSTWASHSFATSRGGLSGREAALHVLLPIAAAAVGITIFGLVFVLEAPPSATY
jgi:hypothetical protein